ncbi:MAG: c-type cytochrome [Pseudomonadota bacterium]
MDIALGEMNVDGKMTKVLLQAPKNGFFYVLDRSDGKLLRAHPYTEGITWATHVDMTTGRPVENPEVIYEQDPQWILPANAGAHNWEPMSFDQSRGLMYFYYHDYANFYSLDEAFVKTGSYEINPIGLSLGIGVGPYRQALEKQAGPRPESKGYLTAFDPLTGQHKWRVRLPSVFNGGVVATASDLLFQGEGNGIFKARSTQDGRELWSFEAYGGFSSSVMTYMIEGTQYVATMVSGSGEYERPGELLVFALDGDQRLAEPPLRPKMIPEQPPSNAGQQQLDAGNTLYHEHCSICHRGLGITTVVATATPDLRMMSTATHGAFEAIVLGGAKSALGMPSFAQDLNREEAEAIRSFVISEANKVRKQQQAQQSTDDAAGSAPPPKSEDQAPRA